MRLHLISFLAWERGHASCCFFSPSALLRSNKKAKTFILLHTSVKPCSPPPHPLWVLYHSYMRSVHTTAPQCPLTMCALEKTAANTTHYKTLLPPVIPSPHVFTLINDRFILTTSRRECSARVQILPQWHGTKRKKSNLILVRLRSRASKYLDIYCSFSRRWSYGCSQSRPDNCPWIGMQMALKWH